jgi:hypothetical protein
MRQEMLEPVVFTSSANIHVGVFELFSQFLCAVVNLRWQEGFLAVGKHQVQKELCKG